MGWATILKAGKPLLRWTMQGGKATIESVGSAVIHPQRTLKGLGTATKTAAIGGAVGYVGWEKLTTDKSVVGIVGDAVLGEGVTEGGQQHRERCHQRGERPDRQGGRHDREREQRRQ